MVEIDGDVGSRGQQQASCGTAGEGEKVLFTSILYYDSFIKKSTKFASEIHRKLAVLFFVVCMRVRATIVRHFTNCCITSLFPAA